MTFWQGYALFILFVMSVVLGIDRSKPMRGMCDFCARAQKRTMNLRTGFLLPFLVGGFTLVICSMLNDRIGEVSVSGALAAFSVACIVVVGLLSAAKKLGQRFERFIWVQG